LHTAPYEPTPSTVRSWYRVPTFHVSTVPSPVYARGEGRAEAGRRWSGGEAGGFGDWGLGSKVQG